MAEFTDFRLKIDLQFAGAEEAIKPKFIYPPVALATVQKLQTRRKHKLDLTRSRIHKFSMHSD